MTKIISMRNIDKVLSEHPEWLKNALLPEKTFTPEQLLEDWACQKRPPWEARISQSSGEPYEFLSYASITLEVAQIQDKVKYGKDRYVHTDGCEYWRMREGFGRRLHVTKS